MSDSTTQLLANIALSLNRIVPICQIILGTFGNIINILIFTRRSLRSNPCSLYFLALSINNLFVLYVALLTRLLASGWQIDPSSTSNVYCKLRLYFVYIALSLTQWFIVLASIDRYLSSCRNIRYRQMSTIPIARKAIIIMTIVMSVIHFHMLVWWRTDYVGSTTVCNIFDEAYDLAFSVFYILVTCLLPPFFMIIFGFKTILNVRKLRTQVTPQNNDERSERLRSKDRQLIIMLLTQVSITILCTAPFTFINLYSTINDNIETSQLSPSAIAVYNFCSNVFRILNYFPAVIGFYIYTLTGRTFRKEILLMSRDVLVWTGLIRCIPINAQRSLFAQDQTLTMNQSVSLTNGRTAIMPPKPIHPPSANLPNKKNEAGK